MSVVVRSAVAAVIGTLFSTAVVGQFNSLLFEQNAKQLFSEFRLFCRSTSLPWLLLLQEQSRVVHVLQYR